MSFGLLVPLVVGFVSVLQAAINRRIAISWGLLPAALLNASVFLVLTAAFLAWARTGRGPFAGMVLPVRAAAMHWYWWLPGVFGLVIVLGLPWAIARVGASTTFIALIAAQIVTSAAWDRLVEGLPISTTRAAGALLVVMGAALVAAKSG